MTDDYLQENCIKAMGQPESTIAVLCHQARRSSAADDFEPNSPARVCEAGPATQG